MTVALLTACALTPAFSAERESSRDAVPEAPVFAFQQQEPLVLTPGPLPLMAPELAFNIFQQRGKSQPMALAWYTDDTEIDAQLPDTLQHGSYELVREYSAPNALAFKPVKFTGDGFVKSNVITRLLQSEVDHVQKQDTDLALSPTNYKFSYKGTELIDGHDVHVYQVKPRHKVVGLFKGKIYLDARTGSLRRAEGTAVKSPSFFIKKIDFVQDYEDIAGFTLPVRAHSSAMTRVVGRAIVDIFHRNYQARAAVTPSAMGAVSAPAAVQ